jgi:hypothetical protein
MQSQTSSTQNSDYARYDVLDGLISAEEARRDYGVVDAQGRLDRAETERLRSS